MLEPILTCIANQAPFSLSTVFLDKLLTACNISSSRPPGMLFCDLREQEKLTHREVEILKWVALGYQNKEIARRGYISITTVKSHVSNIFVKLNVKTRTQAILRAREMNLFKIE